MKKNSTYIEVKNLVKTFYIKNQPPLTVINDVSFNVKAGKKIALVGPTGCGKTTLLKVLGGLIEFDEGSVLYGDKDPMSARKDTLFGFIPQTTSLLPWKTVGSNIALPLNLRKRGEINIENRVEELLDFFGLYEFKNYFPSQISGGMQSRVAIARALATYPEVLLMDECFGNLDELTRERLNVELSPIFCKLETTMVFITHSIREAVFLADEVIVLSKLPAKIVKVFNIDEDQPRDRGFFKSEKFINVSLEIRQALNI